MTEDRYSQGAAFRGAFTDYAAPQMSADQINRGGSIVRVEGVSGSGAGSIDYQAVYNSDVGTFKLTPAAYNNFYVQAMQAGADVSRWVSLAAYAQVFEDPATLAFLRGGGTQSQAASNAGLPVSLLNSSLAAANGAGPAIGVAIPQPNWLLIGGAALAVWYFFLRR